MIISTKRGTPQEELQKIISEFESQGLEVTLIRGADYNVFGLVGDTTKINEKVVAANPWVDSVTRVSAPYKKANRLFHEADTIVDVNGIKILTAYFSGTAPEALRSMAEKVRDKAPNTVAALVGSTDGKITLAVACGKGALDAGLKAGVLVKQIAAIAGGNGGGRPDSATAGGKNPAGVDAALEKAYETAAEQIR